MSALTKEQLKAGFEQAMENSLTWVQSAVDSGDEDLVTDFITHYAVITAVANIKAVEGGLDINRIAIRVQKQVPTAVEAYQK